MPNRPLFSSIPVELVRTDDGKGDRLHLDLYVAAGTAEVALVVDDPDAPRGTFVHWVVVGLDPTRARLAEGAVPAGARQLPNSAGSAAYTGPCPPGGPAHHYRFTVYALGRSPEVAGDADPEAAVQAIEAAATARGRLVGTFGR